MRPELRIIDAAVNRAREALRVLEDTARFVLDHTELTASLKSIRHDLATALSNLPATRIDLLAARDTKNDIGTTISTPSESIRSGLPDIIAAASSRLTESLRSIEECAKSLSSPTVAAQVESIRYRAYDTARDLELALGTGTCPQWTLCVLITESLCTLPWERAAELAIAGGADCIQLREKTLDSAELLARAITLKSITANNAHLIINDRLDIALAANADGVHLGQSDLSPTHARKIAGSKLHIGISTSNQSQARAAIHAGADYCGLGPMFPTNTKHKPDLAGPQYLAQYLADPVTKDRPHLAIGGIDPTNTSQLTKVGCKGVAVCQAVIGSSDPKAACQAIIEQLGSPIASSPTLAP